MKKKNHLVWMDLEMTGLNPEKDRIIEIACLVTDSDLKIVAEGPDLVIHQPSRIMKGMDEWNQQHHQASGLTDAVLASKITVKKAETDVLNFLQQYCFPQMAPLCGNSIHHDRRFIARYMPDLHRFLHYRLVDVSSFKEVIRRWYPAGKFPKKGEKHRALADIRESVEELAFYRRRYFRRASPRS